MKVDTVGSRELFRRRSGDILEGLAVSGKGAEEKEGIFHAGDDWQEVFDTITDVITVHDNNFNIVKANAAAQRLLRLPLQSAAHAKCYEYYHGSKRPPEGCPSCRCLGTGRPAVFEVYEPHLNMYIEIRAIPRFDRDHRLGGLVHIVRDITLRKRVEEELEIHRHHIEWLVKQRTAEISFANAELRREIAERVRVEAEAERLIRDLKDLLRASRH